MGSLFNSICLFTCWLPNILNPPKQTVPSSEPDIAYKTYDYIVVGGGLTGLTVANRLSEDSSRKSIAKCGHLNSTDKVRHGPSH